MAIVANNREEKQADISAVVTHPEKKGIGQMLLAKAVRQSEEWGYEGIIKLSSASPAADKAYEKIGFEKKMESDNAYIMVLEPAKSDKWEKHGGYWQLK